MYLLVLICVPASTDVEHQLCPEEAPFFSRRFPLQTGLTRYSIDLRRRTRVRRTKIDDDDFFINPKLDA